jgi:hypothetical protein
MLESIGNLTAFSFDINGKLIVDKNIRATKGSIKSKGEILVGDQIICKDDFSTIGKCKFEVLQARNIKMQGSVNGGNLYGKKIHCRGHLNVKGDLEAEEEISIIFNEKQKMSILGIIKAPLVILKYRSTYTKWSNLPKKMFSLLRVQGKFKREIYLKNIRINTDHLILDSYFDVDRTNFNFDDQCTIEAKNVEQTKTG